MSKLGKLWDFATGAKLTADIAIRRIDSIEKLLDGEVNTMVEVLKTLDELKEQNKQLSDRIHALSDTLDKRSQSLDDNAAHISSTLSDAICSTHKRIAAIEYGVSENRGFFNALTEKFHKMAQDIKIPKAISLEENLLEPATDIKPSEAIDELRNKTEFLKARINVINSDIADAFQMMATDRLNVSNRAVDFDAQLAEIKDLISHWTSHLNKSNNRISILEQALAQALSSQVDKEKLQTTYKALVLCIVSLEDIAEAMEDNQLVRDLRDEIEELKEETAKLPYWQ